MEKKIDVAMLCKADEKKHLHLNIELVYALDAIVEVCLKDKRFVLKKGDIFLINSNILHSIHLQQGMACRFTLDYRSLSELLNRPAILYWCNSIDEDFAAYRRLSDILDALIQSVLVGQGSSYMQLSLYYQIVDCLESAFVMNDGDRASVHSAEGVIQYINMNYWKTLTLQEAADYMHMSYSAFSKYFKKISGMTFMEYLNNIRMHFAVEELLYTNKTITTIAMEQGFSNPSVFNKNFRNSFHMTPTEYRITYAPATDGEEKPCSERNGGMLERYFSLKRQKHGSEKTLYVYADCDSGRHYKKVWNQAINVGTASNVYSSEMQKQMECAKELLGISYVRVCNILDWDMKIRKGHETHDLNFAFVDRVLDAIVDLGLIPFLELGDKTKSINYSVHKIQEEDREDVFLELSEFVAVLDAFLEHVLHRYGSGMINKWIFELWFNDRKYEREEALAEQKYDYALAFEQTAEVVKKYAPDSRIGGAGIAMRKLHRQLEELMPVWRQRKHPPDFISLYAYPYWNAAKGEGGDRVAYSSRSGFMKHQLEEYQVCAKAWGTIDVPLFLTECNSSLSQRNFFNDSNAKAALLLKNMIDCLEEAEMGIYNPLSDLESVYFDFVKPFSGATGLLSKDGILKPVFYAVRYMNELGDKLIERGDGYIITGDGHDSFQILCCNYKMFNQKFFLKEEYEIGMEALDDIFVDSHPRNIHFVLRNLKDRVYAIKTYKVNRDYANVLKSWNELGRDVPDREEGQYLRAVCLPKLTKRRQQTENGCLHLQETLEAHEIRMIKIE